MHRADLRTAEHLFRHPVPAHVGRARGGVGGELRHVDDPFEPLPSGRRGVDGRGVEHPAGHRIGAERPAYAVEGRQHGGDLPQVADDHLRTQRAQFGGPRVVGVHERAHVRAPVEQQPRDVAAGRALTSAGGPGDEDHRALPRVKATRRSSASRKGAAANASPGLRTPLPAVVSPAVSRTAPSVDASAAARHRSWPLRWPARLPGRPSAWTATVTSVAARASASASSLVNTGSSSKVRAVSIASTSRAGTCRGTVTASGKGTGAIIDRGPTGGGKGNTALRGST